MITHGSYRYAFKFGDAVRPAPGIGRRRALECEDTALGSSRLPIYGGKDANPLVAAAHDTHTRHRKIFRTHQIANLEIT